MSRNFLCFYLLYLLMKGAHMSQISISDSFLTATGTIQYGMTNDYMFRAILQKNKKVLKGFICFLNKVYL